MHGETFHIIDPYTFHTWFFNPQLSYSDLAPNFSGTVYAVGITISCMALIASPYITGIIIEEEASHNSANVASIASSFDFISSQSSFHTWRVVFLISAAAYVGSATIFALLVPAEAQDWNYPKKQESDTDKAKLEATKISTAGKAAVQV